LLDLRLLVGIVLLVGFAGRSWLLYLELLHEGKAVITGTIHQSDFCQHWLLDVHFFGTGLNDIMSRKPKSIMDYKTFFGSVIFPLTVGVAIWQGMSGCQSTPNPHRQEIDKVLRVLKDPSIFSGQNPNVGCLMGGTAIVYDNARWWVKDNIVYAANGTAMGWSTGIDYAPVGVDSSSVDSAINTPVNKLCSTTSR
jgi:hypothetical protein